MSRPIRKSFRSTRRTYKGEHRFEHWYIDNQVYFITATCRDHFHAFSTENAKQIFWQKFDQYAKQFGFEPWVTSLMSNHYHTLGYLRIGTNLKPFMQRLHGSVAKLVNDLLPARRERFWSDGKGKEYFDGAIRDELQCRRAFRYTLTQARRHRVREDFVNYPHTKVSVDLETSVKRAIDNKSFLEGVPYKRYQP